MLPDALPWAVNQAHAAEASGVREGDFDCRVFGGQVELPVLRWPYVHLLGLHLLVIVGVCCPVTFDVDPTLEALVLGQKQQR